MYIWSVNGLERVHVYVCVRSGVNVFLGLRMCQSN